ncbi:hypothetical protein ACP275_04G163600 [Erythranthe tilingii]
MDSANPTFNSDQKSRLLQSLRTRNKTLIIIFFSLIIVLALIIGVMITSYVHESNFRSVNRSPAIRAFCSPSRSQFSCIDSLSSTINKLRPDSDPSTIFLLSLETSVERLSGVVSPLSDGTRPEPSDCLNSSALAAGQLGKALDVFRVKSKRVTVVPTMRRRDLRRWIGAAAEDLARCVGGGVGKARSKDLDRLIEVSELVGYCKEFLANSDFAIEKFRWYLASDRSSRDRIVEDLLTVSLFGLQYFVLVLLFCLLLRIY